MATSLAVFALKGTGRPTFMATHKMKSVVFVSFEQLFSPVSIIYAELG